MQNVGKKHRRELWEKSKSAVTLQIAKRTILVKFGKRKHLEQLLDGTFRFSPLFTFKNDEKNGGINDPNEGTTIQENTNLTIIPQVGESFEIKGARFSTSTHWIQERAIFCLSAPDLIVKRLEKECVVFKVDPDYIERMQTEFKGYDTVAIFDRSVIENELKIYSDTEKIAIWHGEINYFTQKERNEKVYELSKDPILPGFIKDAEMSYQREYRIMLDKKLEEPTFIKINNLRNKCKLISIKDLKDFALFVEVQRDF